MPKKKKSKKNTPIPHKQKPVSERFRLPFCCVFSLLKSRLQAKTESGSSIYLALVMFHLFSHMLLHMCNISSEAGNVIIPIF